MRWLLCALALSGCIGRVADHCSGCAVVRESHPAAVTTQKRALVVLVHGAFGFGSEWDPVVAELRNSPDVAFVVFEWRGPFHELSGAVLDLQTVVQRALVDSPQLTEVLVLAHSAGGPLATRAALGLQVPAGKRVRVVEIDSPNLNGPPVFHTRKKDLPPLPPGVERLAFRAKSFGATHDEAVAIVGLPLIARLEAEVRR